MKTGAEARAMQPQAREPGAMGSWKRPGRFFPRSLQSGCGPTGPWISDFWPQNGEKINVRCMTPTATPVCGVCSGSHRRLSSSCLLLVCCLCAPVRCCARGFRGTVVYNPQDPVAWRGSPPFYTQDPVVQVLRAKRRLGEYTPPSKKVGLAFGRPSEAALALACSLSFRQCSHL